MPTYNEIFSWKVRQLDPDHKDFSDAKCYQNRRCWAPQPQGFSFLNFFAPDFQFFKKCKIADDEISLHKSSSLGTPTTRKFQTLSVIKIVVGAIKSHVDSPIFSFFHPCFLMHNLQSHGWHISTSACSGCQMIWVSKGAKLQKFIGSPFLYSLCTGHLGLGFGK